jgi:hypothetical protein
MQQHVIGDTAYLWFAVNDTAGTGDDGASAACDVRLAGAAASAAPTATPTADLLTDAGYPDGCYEVAIDTTGYSAGTYAVFATLAVDGENPTGLVGSFELLAAAAAIPPTLTDIVNGVRDLVVETEGSYTVQQALSVILAAISGTTTTDGTVLSTPNGSAVRISASVVDQDRTGVVLTPSATA